MSDITSKTEEQAEGGVGILVDGEINTRRFSHRPAVELSVKQWNANVSWQVRREPTNHRVVVAEIHQRRWMWHIVVAMSLMAVIMTIIGLATSLSLFYTFMGFVVLIPIMWAVVGYEKTLTNTERNIVSIVEMDTVIWEGVRAKSRLIMQRSPAAQKKAYKAAVSRAKAQHDKKVALLDKAGKKAAGKPTLPNRDDYVVKHQQLTGVEIVSKIRELMSPESIAHYMDELKARYRAEPELVEAFGRGVKDCGCAACQIAEETGRVPKINGVHAARRIAAAKSTMKSSSSLLGVAEKVAEYTDKNARRKSQAARELAKQERRRREEARRQQLIEEKRKQAERDRKSKEYLRNMKKKKKQ